MEDIVKDKTGKYIPQPLQGLSSLSETERESLIQGWVSSGKLPRSWSMDQAERLYKNKQFRDKYGDDVYAAMTDKKSDHYFDPETRDSIYNREEYSHGIKDKYANDPKLQEYLSMTNEGLEDLWNSGIMSPEELKQREEEINSQRKVQEDESKKIKPKSRFWAAFVNANEGLDVDGRPLNKGVSIKDAAESIAYQRGLLPEKEAKAYEKKANAAVQEELDKAAGYLTVGLSEKEAQEKINRLYASNAKKIEDLQKREDTRIINLPTVQNEVGSRNNATYQQINDGILSYQEVEDVFRKVFDNDVREDKAGSRYYTGYKDKKELSRFGVDDMIQALNEYQVLSEAFGDEAKAMEVMDTKFFNVAKGNQGFWRRRKNTLIGTGAKANAMLVNEIFGGFADLYHAYADNPEEYKKYKTAEDVLTAGGLGFVFNPNYWNYVDQYAVWNPYEIQRINDNSGIGGRMNLYSPTGKMTGEQFVDEGFKMLGYMLPAVAITAATKKVPTGSGWAKLIAGWELAGSAAALGSAYSSGVYNEILLGSQQALDKMFDAESGDFIKQYYAQHPDYINEYLKSNGIQEGDSDLIALPVRMAAERQLYEDAKEAYFNVNKDRRKAYEEAQKQILYDAQTGAKVTNTIETARMLVSGAFWGKWTKSQLTRDFLNKQVNPIKISNGVAAQAGRNVGRAKAAALTLLSGGVDNGLDDITAGIGKGLGINDYNNYLGNVYGAGNYLEGAKFTANIIDGILWGMQGAEEAFYNPQTWIDTALGAAGSVLGARVNGITLVRDAIAKDGIFSNPKTDAGKSWKEQSAWQKLNRYVTNGVTTSIADADATYMRTEEYLKTLNDVIIPKYNDDIQKVGAFLNENYDFNTIADNILDGKDIKQMGMLTSAIRMFDAMKDPVLSQIPQIKEFSDLLKRGKKGNFTEAEIQSYINDPSNTVLKQEIEKTKNMDIAVDDMQHNVNNFLKIADSYSKYIKGVSENSVFNIVNDKVKTQIAVQLTLRDVWKDRLESMQKTTNTVGTEKAAHNFEAEFGSSKGRDEILEALQNVIDDHEEKLISHLNNLKVKRDILDKAGTPEEREAALKAYDIAAFLVSSERDIIAENKALLQEKKKANVAFDEEGYVNTLSADEIMKLSPKQRTEMLDPKNYGRYSPKQVQIIKELSDNLRTSIDENGKAQDLYQVVMDAGIMQDRLENSSKSIKEVVKNPYMVQTYMDRVKERRAAILAQAAIAEIEKEQMQKLETVTTPEEAIDVVFRGKHSADTIDKGFYVHPETLDNYLQEHPDKRDMFKDADDMITALNSLYTISDSLFDFNESIDIKSALAKATKNTNNLKEMMSSIEDLIDSQTDANAKLQFDRVLEKMKTLGYQRDATKLRNREQEREKKQEAELKRIEEEKKKLGETYGWDGYKIGDTVYNKESGNAATVVGFEGKDTMLLEIPYADGTKGIRRYHSEKSKELLSKEKPQAPNNAETVVDVTPMKGNPEEAAVEMTSVEDVNLEVDADGKVDSPTATQQAAAEQTSVQDVPLDDVSEQGNSIVEESTGVISGNRWVTVSLSALKDGVVEEVTVEDPNSVLGRLIEWTHNTKTKLQEIIDEEFGRIITDNPNTEVKFMMMKQTDSNNPLQKVLFNVIELTPSIRQKYHSEDRGGVIQANGKAWLVVGVTGFDNNASTENRKAYDTMKAPISRRRMEYFNTNPAEEYYVDSVASTKVQNTTSGRLVRQRAGEDAPRLRKISELLKSAGRALRQGEFGIQTNQEGEKSFALSKNVKDGVKVFPPRNLEDNKGRIFILVDTANGNKIPGMIEPAMYNELSDNSPLKEQINNTISQLFSTNYEVREKAIKELCGYLVLGDSKNILIGTKDANVLTIKQQGMADITQKLGAEFDIAKFMKDLEMANFQINMTLKSLNDPVMLKMYDDSNALMTNIASMRTAGMSYTLYMTDAAGKPIIHTPVGNAVPGTGRSEFKTYRSVRINNTTYEFKGGKWINRNNGETVAPGSALEKSVIYNDAIQQGHLQPFASKEGKEMYLFEDKDGRVFVVTRDNLHTIEELNQEASDAIRRELQARIENQKRLENLEDVDFGDETPTPTKNQNETLTPEQVAQQAVGNFEEKAEPEVKPQPQKEVIKEAKETQSKPPKEVISDVGTKSLNDLQNTKKLSTFVDVATSEEFGDALYEVLEAKGWGIGEGTFADDEQILKAHKVSTTGITNVEDWMNQIRDCK